MMKTNTETYTVLIHEDEYQLVSDEAETHVLRAAEIVDELMKKMSAGAEVGNKRKVAVMAAIQLASELLHMQEDRVKREWQEKELILLVERSIASV